MSNYRDGIRAYENAAEDDYENFNGYHADEDGYEMQTGFEGNDDVVLRDEEVDDSYLGGYNEYEDEYEVIEEDAGDDYDNYSASSIGRIDPNDRTLTIVVSNSGAQDQEVTLFGGNQELPQHADITVNVEESSHKEVQEESKSNPFTVTGLKLSVSDPLQLDQVLHIIHRSSTGSNTARVYQPRNATSPQNLNPNMIDDANFAMSVSGQDSIRFNQKAGVTSVFTVTISARANIRNVLKGQNVAEMSTAPRTTGLAWLDMKQQSAPKPFGLKKKQVRKIVRRRPAPRQDIANFRRSRSTGERRIPRRLSRAYMQRRG